jgi:hypothetical protein
MIRNVFTCIRLVCCIDTGRNSSSSNSAKVREVPLRRIEADDVDDISLLKTNRD